MIKSTRSILATSGQSYAEMIRSPEWKTFAAGIRRERGSFCQVCKRKDVELHVHHISYDPEKPLMVDEVIVLCWACHKTMHAELKRFRKLVFGNLTPQSFPVLNDALASGFSQFKALEFAYALKSFVAWPRGVERFFADWIKAHPNDKV